MSRSCWLAATALLLAVTGAPAPAADSPAGAAAPTLTFRDVPEMESIDEVDRWPLCAPADYTNEARLAAAEWAERLPLLQTHLTPALVRSLSRWARTEMADYRELPPLAKAGLEPVRIQPDRHRLVLEATLGALPSHSPLVTRTLKAFVLFDRDTRQIAWIALTIRGEAQE